MKKISSKKSKLIFTSFLTGIVGYVTAQVANPPTPTATVNTCDQTLTSATPPAGVTYYWQGTTCGTNTGLGSAATYTASASGTYYLRAYDSWGWSTGCASIAVVNANQQSDPPKPTEGTYTCTAKNLIAATPPSGTTYYWQGTSCGTSTTSPASSPYTITNNTTYYTYYLRAKNNAGCWSVNCSSINTIVTGVIATPPNPTENTPSCGTKNLIAATPPSGTTYYWQGTSCGTSTANPASSPYTITNNTTYVTYYLKARNDAGGCWSGTCSSISAIVSLPCNPPTPTAIVNTCDQTLTRGTPPAGVTYYWQGTTCGTNTTLGSAATYTASATGTYYLRAMNNLLGGGGWSSGCASIAITNANQVNTSPPTPTVNTPSCGPKTLSVAAPPTGVIYYWQGTTCGTSTTNPSSSAYTVSNNSTFVDYYLRAKSDLGCWSLNCSSVLVDNPNLTPCGPADPTTPAVSSNTCGNKTLTRATPPAGIIYYWQGTSCGTSTADSAKTDTASTSGTYYLRAKEVSSSTWSAGCASVAVTVPPPPATPAAPTVSTNTCGDKILTRGTPPVGETYYWQGTSCDTSTGNSALTDTASASGTYYLTSKDNASGCWSACGSVLVTLGTIPTANAGQDATICNGKSTNLNASGGTSYSWSPSTGLSSFTIANPVAKPLITTTYTVTITSGSCSATDSVVITVDPCTGIMESNAKKDVFVYPNPSNGMLTIQNNINAKLSLNITNMIGETVYQEEVNSSTHQVNLTHLADGIYFIKLQGENMNTIQKISIQRAE